MDLLIKGGTVVTESNMFKADVAVQNGKITTVGENISPSGTAKVVNAEGKLVLPGAIDAHTHLAMPFGGTISSDDYFGRHSRGGLRRNNNGFRFRFAGFRRNNG